MKKMIAFLKEARAELKKITWPTWDTVSSSTIVVFIAVIIFTLFIYLLDKGIASIVNGVLG